MHQNSELGTKIRWQQIWKSSTSARKKRKKLPSTKLLSYKQEEEGCRCAGGLKTTKQSMKLHYNSAAVRESWEIKSSFCRLSQIAQEDKNWQAANKFRTQLLIFLQICFCWLLIRDKYSNIITFDLIVWVQRFLLLPQIYSQKRDVFLS